MTLNIISLWQVQMFLEKIDQKYGPDHKVDNTMLGYYMGVCNIPFSQSNILYLRFILDNLGDFVELGEEEKL